jgi:hypothetical protein
MRISSSHFEGEWRVSTTSSVGTCRQDYLMWTSDGRWSIPTVDGTASYNKPNARNCRNADVGWYPAAF